MNAINLIIELAVLIGALGTITAIISKQIGKDIRSMDYNNCKTYLTDFLTDIRNEVKKSDIQMQRASEIYDHYTDKKTLKGNSYIQHEWECLILKKGSECK